MTAYSKSLKPYHGWVVRGVFAVSIVAPIPVSGKAFLCVKFCAQTMCSLGEISEKPCQKLENMVIPPFYKTINNINIIVSDFFQERYKFAIYLTLDDILV